MRQSLSSRAVNTFRARATNSAFSLFPGLLPVHHATTVAKDFSPRPALSIKGRRDGGERLFRTSLSTRSLKPLQGAFWAFSGGLYNGSGPCAAPQARCAGRARCVRVVSQHICTILGKLGVLCAH